MEIYENRIPALPLPTVDTRMGAIGGASSGASIQSTTSRLVKLIASLLPAGCVLVASSRRALALVQLVFELCIYLGELACWVPYICRQSPRWQEAGSLPARCQPFVRCLLAYSCTRHFAKQSSGRSQSDRTVRRCGLLAAVWQKASLKNASSHLPSCNCQAITRSEMPIVVAVANQKGGCGKPPSR